MILVDSNIPMYLVGANPVHKADMQQLIHKLAVQRERLVTDAEVLQEILHRYTSIHRHAAIQPAFDTLLGIVDEVFSVDHSSMERAKQIVLSYSELSSRDAVHLAVMQQQGINRILSYDKGFDRFPGVTRLS